MKKVFLLVVAIVALMAAGVIHFQNNGDEVNISIDRARLRQVSGKIIGEGKELIEGAQEDFENTRRQASDMRDRYESEFNNQPRGYDNYDSGYRNQSRRFDSNSRQPY
jgi:hypothetical protein